APCRASAREWRGQMAERPLVDRLEQEIQALLGFVAAAPDRELEPYVSLARELRELPRPAFRLRLKADLQRGTTMTVTNAPLSAVRQTAAPALRVKNAAAAIDFYKTAFEAQELFRFVGHGRVAHAELAIGNSIFMLGEEAPDYGFPGPETLGGSPMLMHLYVDDVDASVEQAVAAGARLAMPVTDQFYGDRSGAVT